MKVFVDTSAIAALLIKSDSNHFLSVDILKALTEQGAELVISNFIVAETYNLLSARTYPALARRWLYSQTFFVIHRHAVQSILPQTVVYIPFEA